MNRFFRGIGDRIRGTNSAEERAEAAPETRDEPDGFWSDFGTTDVAARSGSTSAALTDDAGSVEVTPPDNDGVDAAASTDSAPAEPAEDASSNDVSADNDGVDAAASTDSASEEPDEESSDTDDGGSEDSDSGTTDSDSDELLITADGDDSTTLTGGVVSDGSGTVIISEDTSDTITLSDGSGSGYEDTPGLETDTEEDSESDSEAGVEADSNQTDEDPESDSEVGVEADPYQTDVVEVPEQTAEVEVPDDLVVGDGVINVDDVSSDGGMPDTRVPVPGNLGDVTVNRFASFTDDDDDETEVPKDYLIEKPNVELQRDPSLYPENPQPKAGEVLDVMGSPAEMSATAAGFTMAEQPQEPGFMAEQVRLVEPLGSDVYLKAEDGGPVEATGFTATDDLWREGSGEKLEFMTDMSSEIDMEVFFNHSLKAEAGESGQDTGAGWDPTPAGSYAVVDPSSVGKESGEPEPVVVEGTAVAASDLEFTMPAASADESGGKESGLDGILTPVPEPDYSLGPAPMPPDPIDKDNYFDDTHKDVGLLDAQPMEMDPTAQTQYGDSNEWFEEQYQESGGDSGGDSGDGDDDDIPG